MRLAITRSWMRVSRGGHGHDPIEGREAACASGCALGSVVRTRRMVPISSFSSSPRAPSAHGHVPWGKRGVQGCGHGTPLVPPFPGMTEKEVRLPSVKIVPPRSVRPSIRQCDERRRISPSYDCSVASGGSEIAGWAFHPLESHRRSTAHTLRTLTTPGSFAHRLGSAKGLVADMGRRRLNALRADQQRRRRRSQSSNKKRLYGGVV
jgi:hypothetical protein